MTYTTANYMADGGATLVLGGALTADGAGVALDATFTIGTETANAINVAVTLVDGQGNALTNRAGVFAYLSSNATTLALASTAEDIAIGTNGVYIEQIANAAGWVVSTAAGLFDLTITETTGAATYYLVLLLPTGRVVVSGAITFV